MFSIELLSESPDDIFKMFEFHQIIRRFQDQLGEPSDNLSAIKEINIDSQDDTEVVEEVGLESEREEEVVDSQDEEHPESVKEEKIELDESTLDRCLHVMEEELVSDDELYKLPSDALKQVFPFFMKVNFQMPDIDETVLGKFLLRKKEEQIEDLTTFELEQMLNFTLKENKVLKIQNEVFKWFLDKNDPRFDKDYVKSFESSVSSEEVSLEITSTEMTRSKVVFPDMDDCGSNYMFMQVLNLYTKVVEHEIKDVYKEYEKDLNKFTAKMKSISQVQSSLKIHREKMTETLHLLKTLVVKKHKKKMRYDLAQFAEFLKATIKQDQQDLRRFRVLTYEYNKKIGLIKKCLKSHDRVRKVDLELYEIKSKELSTKLCEQNDEFLQLKKIFDSYQRRLDRSYKTLEDLKKTRFKMMKSFLKKKKDLEVQRTCYKMALESFIELCNSTIHLVSTNPQISGSLELDANV